MDILSFIEYELKKTPDQLINILQVSPEFLNYQLKHPDEAFWSIASNYLSCYRSKDYILKYERPFSKPLSVPPRRFSTVPHKKPRIAFIGKSDAGKSALINSLFGRQALPTNWTPTTSAPIYIKHNEEKVTKGNWIAKYDTVGIYRRPSTQNSTYTLVDHGGIELLTTYATHMSEKDTSELIATVYLDCPILRFCDFVDVPGITSEFQSDNKEAIEVIKTIDYWIYLSPANAFLSEGDMHYIDSIIQTMRDLKILKNLEHVYFIASQADTLNDHFDFEIKKILSSGCHRLREYLKQNPQKEKALLKHFFAYSTKLRIQSRSDFENNLVFFLKNF